MSKLKGNTNIVSYEDHAVIPHEEGIGWNIYIRMELLTPLFDYIKNHQLSIRDVICLGIDMCNALEICQRYNIIHRDIKPENIFISNLGKYKLGDFGIARQLEKTSSVLSKKGTYTYMAPEVYKGEKYNSTVDIYSLGIVLYRFLNNNRTPFLPAYPMPIRYSDKEKANVMRMSGTEMPKPCNAEGRLAEIVLKACAYNPKERYESAVELKKALQSVMYEEKEIELIYPEGDKLANENVEYEISSRGRINQKEETEDTFLLFQESQKETEEKFKLQKEQERKKKEAEIARQNEEEERKKKEAEIARQKEEEERKKKEVEKVRQKERDEKRRDFWTFRKKAAIAATVCVIAVGSVGGYQIYIKSLERTVPDITNVTFAVAEERAAGEDGALLVVKKGEEYSDTVAKGCVISQNVKEGTVLKKGDEIGVIVSKGALVEVPNLVGMKSKKAEKTVSSTKLIYKVAEEQYSDDIKKGKIISQDLEAGSKVEEQKIISVIVSKGIEQITVPNVIGKSEEKAKKILEKNKLRYTITEDYSDTINEGNIVSQNLDEGRTVDKNTVVKLVVSLGKEPEPVYTPSYDRDSDSSSSSSSSSGSGSSSPSNSGSSSKSSGSSTKKKSSSKSNDISSWDLVN